MPEEARSNGQYKDASDAFLAWAFEDDQDAERHRRVLSNPMNLTIAAELLWRGETPDLSRLREQVFDRIEQEYKDAHADGRLPLQPFLQWICDLRVEGRTYLTITQEDGFRNELRDVMQLLEKHKLASRRPLEREVGWLLHDSIIDYFTARLMLKDRSLRLRHCRDRHFLGTYELLAEMLTLEEARELRDAIALDATERPDNDHMLSDSVIRIVARRQGVSVK